MKNLYFLELNEVYDNQVRLPYSTGVIWSYCKTIDTIATNYNLSGWFYCKDYSDTIIKSIKNPDVIVFSSSIWNWDLNIKIAKKIKHLYPNVLTICGGPQIPKREKFLNESEKTSPYWGYPLKDWFKHHDYFDIISSGEGEFSIAEILRENLTEGRDFKKVPGCIIRNEDNTFHMTPFRGRIKNITEMPSPYLDGTFDVLIEESPQFKYVATIETTRGCPFHCTFCDQGTDYFNKLELLSLEKIKSEIEWIVQNKITYIDNADSNFGMFFERDKSIAEFLVASKLKTGFPEQYSSAWAKGKTKNNIEIMKILKTVDLDRGVSMALQSLNPEVLKNIRRKNINDGSVIDTINSFESQNIGVFVELILGLPGETLSSFLDGIFSLLEMGFHKFIGIYVLQVLPNTEFSDIEYIEKHGLILKETQPNAAYIVPTNRMEKDVIVVGSNSMSHEDWIESFLYKVLIVGCHCYGSTQYISRYLNDEHKISYRDFYVNFYSWAEIHVDAIIGKELQETKKSLLETLENQSHWNRFLPNISEHTWIHEEALAIMIMKNKQTFFIELEKFISEVYGIKIPHEILNTQYYGIVDPNINYPIVVDDIKYELNWNRDNFDGDYNNWAKECIWWGRKSSRYMTKITKLT